MANHANERMRAYRKRLSAQGLRPVQHWLPDTRSRRFRVEARRQSLLVGDSAHEREIMDFIEKASDREGWET